MFPSTVKTDVFLHSIVEPHFGYCSSVWDCAGSNELNKLQKFQDRAAGIITKISYDTPSRPIIDKIS